MRLTFCFSRNCSPYPTIFALRPWPCWPGGKFLFSMPQEGLKQRSPLRNNFIPSRRHNLHTGPEYLANVQSPLKLCVFLADGSHCVELVSHHGWRELRFRPSVKLGSRNRG